MKPYRNRKLLDAARDVSCIRCGKEGETRASHYNGVRQHLYGKGRGQKCSDLLTSEFCGTCDMDFSEGISADSTWSEWERSEEFLHWIAMTNLRRIERGLLG